MEEATRFLQQHSYLVLFVWTLVDQFGLPVLVLPALLAAGALAGTGQLDGGLLVAISAAASFLAIQCWYELGRRRGYPILSSICRLAMEPSVCIRKSQDVFARHRVLSLLLSRFVPGLGVLTPPLAGITGMARGLFVLINALGSVLWAALAVGLGWALQDQLADLLRWISHIGDGALVLIVSAMVGYGALKYVRRRRVLRRLRGDCVDPQEPTDKPPSRQ